MGWVFIVQQVMEIKTKDRGGKVKVIKGDLLKAEEDIIIHQVNCQGAYGAGLAKQIAQKYPETKKEYVRYCNINNKKDLLGDCLFTKTDDFIIANLFGQYNYGRYGSFYKKYSRQTDYKAFAKGLKIIKDTYPNKSIAIPYKIGCGLANGNWDKIKEIFNLVFPEKEIIVYKL